MFSHIRLQQSTSVSSQQFKKSICQPQYPYVIDHDAETQARNAYNRAVTSTSHFIFSYSFKRKLLFYLGKVTISYLRKAVQVRNRGGKKVCVKSRLGGCSVYLSKIMHWMDARALRRKDAFRGERPWGDTVCDPWISDRETVSKLRG